jgi:F-type H+-transporting ATPase subunit b
MQAIIQQLEAMFIGSVPTTILFVVLVIAYSVLVQGPLTAALKKRRALTEGAMEDARNAIAQAEARKAAGAKVGQAKAELETEAAAARQTIQGSAGDLAGQVVRAVLPAAAGGSR